MFSRLSSKFRVVLHQEGSNGSPPAANAARLPLPAHAQNAAASSRPPSAIPDTSRVSTPPLEGGVVVQGEASRRYGGAIVRVSELRQSGGIGSSDAVSAVRSAPVSGTTALLWRDFGLGGGDSSSFPDTRDGSPSARRGARGGGRRQAFKTKTQFKRGKRAGKTRGRTSRRRPSQTEVELTLQPNGELFDHSWSTVRGRRRLHYNGRTYTGGAAHALWAKMKEAGTTRARRVSVESRASVPTRVTPKARAAVQTAINVPPPRSHASVRRPSSRAAAAVAQAVPRPRLNRFLDDEHGRGEREGRDNVNTKKEEEIVVLSSSSSSSSSLRSGGREADAFSWGSGSIELETPSDGSLDESEAEDEVANPRVVEHDGWLYPAHLAPVQPHTERRERATAQGITFLGNTKTNLPLQEKTHSRLATSGAPYAERYEEQGGLDGLSGADVEGMFVVGDEIGGIRFA